MKKQSIKSVEHIVYDDINEFKETNPNIEVNLDWKKGKVGEWVLCDDGGVCQILKRGQLSHPKDSRNYKLNKGGYVRTVVGTFIVSEKSFMDSDFDAHPNRYTFSGKIASPKKRIKERDNLTNKEVEFVSHIISGKSATESYVKAYGQSKNPQKKAVVLLKQDRIQKEVEKSVLDVAKEQGIDHEYILRRLKCVADRSEDEMVQLRAITELGKAIGTLGGNTIKKQEIGIVGMFDGFKPDELDVAKRPEKEIEVSNK